MLSGPNSKLDASTKAEISCASRQLDIAKSIFGQDASDDKGRPGLHKDTIAMGEGNEQDVILEDNMKRRMNDLVAKMFLMIMKMWLRKGNAWSQ